VCGHEPHVILVLLIAIDKKKGIDIFVYSPNVAQIAYRDAQIHLERAVMVT